MVDLLTNPWVIIIMVIGVIFGNITALKRLSDLNLDAMLKKRKKQQMEQTNTQTETADKKPEQIKTSELNNSKHE